jgi:hypothetical protein
MRSLRRRGLPALLAVGLLFVTSTGAAAEVASGGDTTGIGGTSGVGVCDAKVQTTGPATDGPLQVAIGQEWAVTGSGFPPSTEVVIDFVYVPSGGPPAFKFTVQSESDGTFVAGFRFEPGSEGEWFVDVYVPPQLPACRDGVTINVVTGHPFTDIAGHFFEPEITWLYQSGITTGCSSTLFCPDFSVTREQMASFLVRALGLPPSGADVFTDDETSIHETDINTLAANGIATGCGGGRYCPGQVVTREQMASFLRRAFGVGPSGTDSFTDDETSIHEDDINAVAAAGIATGCGGGRYCPLGTVTRGQMAAFLERILF